MANVRISKDQYLGVKQSINAGAKFLHFVNADVKDMNKALVKAKGNKLVESVACKFANTDKTSMNASEINTVLFKRTGDERTMEDRVINAVNVISKTYGNKGFVVIGAMEIFDVVASRKDEMPADCTVIFGDWAYDGFTRKLTDAEKRMERRLYSKINNFEYNKFVSKKEIEITNMVARTNGQEVELNDYELLKNSAIGKGSTKANIMCPVIERKMIKPAKKGDQPTFVENTYFDRRSESAFVRHIGFNEREAIVKASKTSVFSTLETEYKKAVYSTYDIAYVDLIESPTNPEKQLEWAQEYLRTEQMVKKGFYVVPTKLVTTSKIGAVLEEEESFVYAMTNKEAQEILALNSGKEIIRMEALMASQSQVMNNKATFVNADLQVPENLISAIEARIAEGATLWGESCGLESFYVEYLRSLRGRAAGLEIATYFSFGAMLSNEFVDWAIANNKIMNLDLVKRVSKYEKKILGGGAKLNIRAAASLTNSNGLKKEGGWDISSIGSVKFILTEELLKDLMTLYCLSEDKVKAAWKTEKLDGQSIIRKSILVAVLRAAGLYVEANSIQARAVSQKGMLLAVEDEIFDRLGFTGDIVVEENSFKYALNSLAQDMFDVALVNKEKKTNKCKLNYQYINTFGLYDTDENGNRFNNSRRINKEYMPRLVNKAVDVLAKATEGDEASILRVAGVYGRDNNASIKELGVSIEDNDLTTKVAMAASVAGSEIVKDGYLLSKLYEIGKGSIEKLLSGGLTVEGATKYVVSDTTAMLRTDLMARESKTDANVLVDAYGNVLARRNENGVFISTECVLGTDVKVGDIVISSREQVALQGLHDCYWGNAPRTGEVLLCRVPCTHPGEPQKANLVDIRNVVKSITVLDKDGVEFELDTRAVLDSTPDVINVGGFNIILEALGGADTDGDRLHIILDQDVIDLRPAYSDVPPCIVESASGKDNKIKVGFNMVPGNILSSLRDSGTGLLTDIDTMLLDMAHILQYFKGYYEELRANNKSKDVAGKAMSDLLKDTEGFMDALKSIQEAAVEILDSAAEKNTFFDRDTNGNIVANSPLVEEEDNMRKWAEINLEGSMATIDELIALIGDTCVMLKRLQEKAIASPKTGIYIFFDAIGHLTSCQRRPYWYKPGALKARYNTFFMNGDSRVSLSPMDAVFNTVQDKYEELESNVYRNEEEFASFEDYMFDGFDYLPGDFDAFDYFEDTMELEKTMSYDVAAENAKKKFIKSGKMILPIAIEDKAKYVEASVLASKLGKEYKDEMKLVSSESNKTLKATKLDNLVAKYREALDSMEEEFGFINTYMAAYNTANVDASGNKIDATPSSFVWLICADKMFMLLNAAFRKKHMLMRKEDAVKKGLSFVDAFDNYVAVTREDITEEVAMTMVDDIFSGEFVFSVHGINKAYGTNYVGAKDAIMSNLGRVMDVEHTVSVKVNEAGFVELFANGNPILTMQAQSGTQDAAVLIPLNGKDITIKLSNKQARNFNTIGEKAGKSVKLAVTGIL